MTTLTRFRRPSPLRSAPAEGRRRERGDVPGWVLITLMTAGLVVVLWGVAEDQLVTLFKSALASVAR